MITVVFVLLAAAPALLDDSICSFLYKIVQPDLIFSFQSTQKSMGCLPCRIPTGVKICCAITTVILIAFAITITILCFTLLKPKKPILSTKSVTLEDVEWVILPFHLNVTIGLVITVDNRNYGSFKHHNSTTYVTYRGDPAGEALIGADTIPARAKHDIATNVVMVVDNLTSNPYFWVDFNNVGCLNFTSSTSLHGKATVLKLLKIKVTTLTTCDISVFVKSQNVSSKCSSKVEY